MLQQKILVAYHFIISNKELNNSFWMLFVFFPCCFLWVDTFGAGFSNELLETLSYKELLKHKFYLIQEVRDKYATYSNGYTFHDVIGSTS